MKVNAPRLLTNFYATLTVGMVGFSLLAYILPAKVVWSMMAFMNFLFIVFAFALDVTIDRIVGRKK